ncbi:hypothetical protein ACR80S_13450 [Halomonas sp. MA07-2]|uniref:hypothetical protein n=1 Tax=Halomonas sp. MA07-2 TaxID=3440841 RepID=UPI003EE97682
MTQPITGQVLGRAAPIAGVVTRPLFGSRVRAGVPSPADDHLGADINLHAYVVKHPTATFFVRA